MISVRRAETEADLQTCLRIRWTVFVEEQGVPPSLEVDEYDRAPDTFHLIGLNDRVPAGAGRLIRVSHEEGKIGRLAVIDDVRGSGLGKLLLQSLEEEARRRGMREVQLHAQVHARAFYERLGYVSFGDVFDDAGIPHIALRKAL